MREIRTSGSEEGEARTQFAAFPYPYAYFILHSSALILYPLLLSWPTIL